MTGCTDFFLEIFGTPDAKLLKADIAKLAEKHGVNLDWAKMCLNHWLRRG